MHALWWMDRKSTYLPLSTEILFHYVTRGWSSMTFLFLAHINEVLPGLCSGPVKVPLFCRPVWFAFTPQSGLATAKDYFDLWCSRHILLWKVWHLFLQGKSDHVAFIRVFPDPHLHLTYLKLMKLEKELRFSNRFCWLTEMNTATIDTDSIFGHHRSIGNI